MATKKHKNKRIVPSLYNGNPHYFEEGGTPKLNWNEVPDTPNYLNQLDDDIYSTENKGGDNNKSGFDASKALSIATGAANAGMQMFTNLTEDDDLYDSGDINARGWKITSNLLGLGNSAYNLARPDASPEIQNQIKSNNAILDEAAKDIGQTIKINAMDDASNLDLFHSHVADDINTDYDLSRNAGETIAGIGSSMLEGAKSGSIGGPWGALGGAVAGLGAGLIGAFNGTSQAKASERMRKIRAEQIAKANEIDFRNRQMASKAIHDFNINNYRMQTMTNPDIILQGANYAALGGPLFTNGGIFDNGIDYIGTGGTHGQNKLGGVPMGIANDGQPNLVEEGEAIWHNGNDDYVFSNRIKIPKRLRTKYRFKDNVSTFADAVNYIQKASEERPNDPIEQRTIDNILKEFQTEQEIIRQRQAQREQEKMMRAYAQYPEMMQQMQMQQDPNAMQQMPPEMMMQQQMPQEIPSEGMPVMGAYGGPLFAGGGILIKPSKRGTFTAAATKHGMGVQEFANKVLANPEDYSPAMRKKANFARNSSHWHGLGGHMFPEGGPTKQQLYNAMGWRTDDAAYDWVGNSAVGDFEYDFEDPNFDYSNFIRQQEVLNAIARTNPALAHAIRNGYNWTDPYNTTTSTSGGYDWDNFWGTINAVSKQNGVNSDKYRIDNTYKEDIKKLENSTEYKDFTDYILNKASDDERLKYFGWIDENTGNREKKYISNGNLVQDWKDRYFAARNDGKYGIQHYIPEMLQGATQRGQEASNFLIQADGSVVPLYGDDFTDYVKDNNFAWGNNDKNITYNYYRAKDKTTPNPDNSATTKVAGKPYKYKPDWMANLRYMPALGSAFGVLSDTMGWSNVPDYTYANELEQAAKRRPTLIGYKPIGDYMMHTPEDRNYMANQIAQQQNAGRRALIDNANGNIGATQMGLLGNSFNTGITLGDLYDKTQRASVDDRKIVNDFNRGTNQFNATAYNRAQEFNAGLMDNYLNRQYDAKAKSLAMKQAEDARVDAARQANLTTLFNNIGDIGWEAYNRNMINSNNALYYGTGRLGNSFYKNQWDDMTDEQRALAMQQMYLWISNPPQVRTGRPASGQSTTNKNGGYITIKNKRRK